MTLFLATSSTFRMPFMILLLRMYGIEHLLGRIMIVALLIEICVEFGIFQNIFCN
ncbi:hypothetical protein RHMOL_Rhmol06G0022200 [Rhododendron molle]|uniref:Uncharacterized protein n=1 Tax=Rhododendron molle TaxID=49168 RepID=A0ACC0N8J2_RHOML|nr:hypothetical protein RHMOL_Rhmol06G0022200 [Rhododendron molle]